MFKISVQKWAAKKSDQTRYCAWINAKLYKIKMIFQVYPKNQPHEQNKKQWQDNHRCGDLKIVFSDKLPFLFQVFLFEFYSYYQIVSKTNPN